MKDRTGIPGFKNAALRDKRFHMRCSEIFLKVLQKCSDMRAEDLHPEWTKSDVLHIALYKYAQELGIKDLPDKL
jgi:hypothetical protein